jgi:polyisoprenoid-binding protein YceI
MRRILLLFVILGAPILFAEQQTYEISPQRSALDFYVSAQIHHVHGKSTAFSGTITGDPADISTAKIDVKLDPQTFDTDNDKRDKVMREKSLEVDKYPFIKFTSSSIRAPEKQLESGKPMNVTVNGRLELHGVEQDVSIPVNLTWNGNELSASGDLALHLDDWKIYRPKIVFFRLQNDITIHLQIGAMRVP